MCVFLSVFGLIYLVYQTFNVVYNLLKSSCNARPEKYATNSARAAAFHVVTSKCVCMGVCGVVCLHATLPKHQGILVSTTFSYAQLFNTPDELPKFSQHRLPWGLP